MKTKSMVRTLFTGISKTLALACLLMVLPQRAAAAAATPSDLLEKGIYTEETKGEVDKAIEFYQQIIDDPAAERSLVAQAQLRLGLCHLKLGNKSKAVSALERLTQDFPDKESALASLGTHFLLSPARKPTPIT